MSLYQCENCGCCENTALSNYWWEHVHNKGPALCSACTKDGNKPAGWHGCFERVFLPKGVFRTNRVGNLAHVETGDEDFRKYRIDPPLQEE